MLKITILRHGQTDGNSKGKYIGTTDEPLLDAEIESLKAIKFPIVDAVYASPLKRCVQTAAILFPYEQARIIPELAERDFGLFEGKTYKELTEDLQYRQWVSKGEIVAFPGGEELSEFKRRIISGFEQVVADAVKKAKTNIAIVAHGGTIMSILEEYGFPKQSYIKWIVKNGEGYRLRLSPRAFTDADSKEERKIIVDGKIVRP